MPRKLTSTWTSVITLTAVLTISATKAEEIINTTITGAEPPTPNLVREAMSVAPKVGHSDVDELIIERYSNGKVKAERQVTLNSSEDFVNNGIYRAFDPEGRSLGTGKFEMGVRSGQWERIFRSAEGVVLRDNKAEGFSPPYRSIANFENGKLHGDWHISDVKGRAIIQWHFERGDREGPWIWFNPDGSIVKQVIYQDNHVSEDIVASDAKGKLKVLKRYLDGRALVPSVSWHGRGKARTKKSEGYVLMPKEITKVKVDWWKGNVERQVVRAEGKQDRHGQWKFWYPNGKLEMQGTFDRGQAVGLVTWWHSNGQKSAEGLYEKGLPHGPWQTWYSGGARQSYGEFVDGKREGKWLSWHENGMRKFEGLFAAGSLDAKARTWDDGGRRLRTEGDNLKYLGDMSAPADTVERKRMSKTRDSRTR